MGGYELFHEGKAFTPDADPVVETTKEASDARNAELGAAEVEAFQTRQGDRWFAYWHPAPKPPSDHPYYKVAAEIRTFMGDVLATVTWCGSEYSSPAFGGSPSKRVNFRAKGIDGRMWAGTYYMSSGDYVRMHVVKGK